MFRSLMVQKNMELQLQALRVIKERNGRLDKSTYIASQSTESYGHSVRNYSNMLVHVRLCVQVLFQIV